MTTTNTNNTTDPAASLFASLNGSSSKSSSSVSEQQDRFLKLLTTQLKNQDPLNPLDNAQMTSQLAEISMVDGLSKLNTTLSSLVSSSTNQQALLAATLVGHGALVEGNTLQLSSSGAIGGFDLAGAADKVTVQVKDAAGNAVRTITLDKQEAGAQNFVWDGKDDNGNAMSTTGTYTFTVTATQGGNDVKVTALKFGTISGVVKNSSGSLGVDVGTFGRFALDDLKQII